jgi:mycothiol S-conjugate amidase
MPAEARRPFSRLYYHVMPAGFLRAAIFLMRLKGLDPRKAGANEDIDLVAISSNRYQTHARVHYRDSADAQKSAIACHASQGGMRITVGVLDYLRKLFGISDRYMQAYPPPPGGRRQKDLFAGLD